MIQFRFRCGHRSTIRPCPECQQRREENVGNAVLASQLRGLPALQGSLPQIQSAVLIRELFNQQLEHLRTLAAQLRQLPAHYWSLLRADQALLDGLHQEFLLVAERGDALLQEEVQADFWVQHIRGNTRGVALSQNQKTITLLGVPQLGEVARYQPFVSKSDYDKNNPRKNQAERLYRQSLPRTVQCLLEWLVSYKTVVRWQEEREARRLAQEQLRLPPKKTPGGKRTGAGRPKKEPTRVLPLRVKDSLYLRLTALAQEADLPLSVFVENYLKQL